MRKWIVVLAGAGLLLGINLVIAARERLLDEGRVVLLELTPVDPRSLMQGDYMALRFKVVRDAFQPAPAEVVADGRIVLGLDARGVATFRRFDNGAGPAADEVAFRYRIRHGTPKLGTNAFFFEEGRVGDYAKARYGEFRVAPNGEAILTALRDEALRVLGGAPKK
jgi:uncharacterized membrane-anchored protein